MAGEVDLAMWLRSMQPELHAAAYGYVVTDTAVGLTGTISAALAGPGISANVGAGFYHDHVFVPWERRLEAMAALRELNDA